MTLEGTWKNSYGSTMELTVPTGNLVMGTYRSSTGSTGEYQVVGYQQPLDPTPARGQAVALAIEWHSIGNDPPDPSWHWSSGLSGQLSVVDGVEQLVLAHALVASTGFPGLTGPGTYVDKLTYTREAASVTTPARDPRQGELADDPLSGEWASSDGTELDLAVYPYSGNKFGVVVGKLIEDHNISDVFGVTDITASSAGVDLQSVAITGLAELDSTVLALAGDLDLGTGELGLLEFASVQTAPSATYVQTRLSASTFTRRSPSRL